MVKLKRSLHYLLLFFFFSFCFFFFFSGLLDTLGYCLLAPRSFFFFLASFRGLGLEVHHGVAMAMGDKPAWGPGALQRISQVSQDAADVANAK